MGVLQKAESVNVGRIYSDLAECEENAIRIGKNSKFAEF
jgi:hypothetical protein